MDNPAADKAQLRTRDFWAELALIVLSLFFLWRTSHTVSGRKPRGRQRGGLVQFRGYRAVWCLGRDADPVFCVAWHRHP
jgi:hypothetical protein